jgi:carboxyl-terminal processing protease
VSRPTKEYVILQPLLLSVMLAIGIFLGYKMNDNTDPVFFKKIKESDGAAIYYGRVEEVLNLVNTHYFDEVNQEDLVEVAIAGMLEALDPHSRFIPARELNEINQSMQGSFTGFGVETLMLDDTLQVIRVIDNSPAYTAGLMLFDRIISINSQDIAGQNMPVEKVWDALRINDTVNLQIKRKNEVGTITKTMIKAEIDMSSATAHQMINDHTGFIAISQFGTKTYNEFMSSLEDLIENHGMKHLVIDLRDNPGGYLPEATRILNQLINEKGRLMVSTVNNTGRQNDYTTNGKVFFPDIDRIAVLVNEGSASGSEVMAAAIQDWDRGIIIGRKTYGKGLVQEQFDVSGGAALRLTVAKYFTPAGRYIQRTYKDGNQNDTITQTKTLIMGRTVRSNGGIYPDIEVNNTAFTKDAHYGLMQSYALEYSYRTLDQGKSTGDILRNIPALKSGFLLFVQAKDGAAHLAALIEQATDEDILFLLQKALAKFDANSLTPAALETDAFVKEALKYCSGEVEL